MAKITVSDWINFLSSKINQTNIVSVSIISIIISLSALFFVVWAFQLNLISLMISAQQTGVSDATLKQMENLLKNLTDLRGYILVFIIITGAFGYSYYFFNIIRSKPNLILNEVLRHDGRINPDEIRKKWFKKPNNKSVIFLMDKIEKWKNKK